MTPRRFFVSDLSSTGDIVASAEYTYEMLEKVPGAAELIVHFSTNLYRSPQEFETSLPHVPTLAMRWLASAETAGIATLRNKGKLTSLALLVSGLNADADHLTLEAFAKHLLRELHGTAIEPSFALMEIAQRPLVASVAFAAPTDQTQQLVTALADRCFAAAYFRYLNLA
jgi:hypothetical protein